MDLLKWLQEAKAVAERQTPEMMEFAKQNCSQATSIDTYADGFAWTIGYLNGYLNLAVQELARSQQVGGQITVRWSNGHGHSVYQIVENTEGPHSFRLVEEVKY